MGGNDPVPSRSPPASVRDSRVQHVRAPPVTLNGVQLVGGEGMPHVIVISEVEHVFGQALHLGFQRVRERAVSAGVLVPVAAEETQVGALVGLLSELRAGGAAAAGAGGAGGALFISLAVYSAGPRAPPRVRLFRFPEE